MNGFEQELENRLTEIRAQGLYREWRTLHGAQGPHINPGNGPLLNFSSNDYLGLANDPALKEAAIRAIECYGVGSGASRLVCGTLEPHVELETALANFKNTEAALAFSSGYAAAVGTINALMDKSSIVVVDKLVHACVIDAVRMCGAKLRVYKHNDMKDLERILQWAGRANEKNRKSPHVLVVTESVFSMDGDHAPLRDIVGLKEKYGAWLMVDEAHATGLYGPLRPGRRGKCRGSYRNSNGHPQQSDWKQRRIHLWFARFDFPADQSRAQLCVFDGTTAGSGRRSNGRHSMDSLHGGQKAVRAFVGTCQNRG